MSNYNLTLQSNNTGLQAILNTINELPAAGGGTQATPVISVNSSTGLITATAGTKTSTHQLAFQAAKTITPTTTNQTISAGTYLTGAQTIKGDANLVAGNIKSGISIFGVNGTLVEGGASSGEQVEWSTNEDAIISRTLGSYFNDRVTSIRAGAFYSCYSLTTVSFPACKTIGSAAFRYCSSLTTVSFPACTTIGSDAFRHCFSLTTVSFPACTTISSYAFHDCINLTTVSFPACKTIGSAAFQYCSSLTTVSFPAATTIGSIVFRSCFRLQSFYLTGSSVCKLSNSNVFTSTPYAGYSASFSGTPYIYVPSSLVASYKTATNWTYFSSYFKAIEDTLITFWVFTDKGDEYFYHAEEGMTFGEWVESEYNTDGWKIVNNTVVDSSGVIDIGVSPSTIIWDESVYIEDI